MNIKSTLITSVIAFIILLRAGIAQADQPVNMVRTLCIRENNLNHFSVYLQSFPEIANYINGYNRQTDLDETKTQRLDRLKKYNVLSPNKLNYTCKLAKHSYRIIGTKPLPKEKGMCGGDPRTQITLEIDGAILLDKVFFEPSCFADLSNQKQPSMSFVKNISIDENASVQYTISDGYKEKIILGYLNVPINQKTLEEATKKLSIKK